MGAPAASATSAPPSSRSPRWACSVSGSSRAGGRAGGGATGTSRTRTTGADALKTVTPTSSLRAEGSTCSVEFQRV